MRETKILIAALAVLASASCSMLPGRSSDAPRNASTVGVEEQGFLAAALGRSDSALALARMAEQKATIPAVKLYAQKVLDDQTKLHDQLLALATSYGAGAASNLAPTPQQLADLQGADFDTAYLNGQLESQQDNLDAFQFEASSTSDPQLRQFAAAAVPVLQQDLQATQTVAAQIPPPQNSLDEGTIVGARPMNR